MVNNSFPYIKKKKFILGKLILIGLFIWFFSSVLAIVSKETGKKAERWIIWEDLMEGDWLTFIKFIHPVHLFEENIGGIFFIIGLIIGLYLGLKKGGKAIFYYPIISFCIFGFLAGIFGIGLGFFIPFFLVFWGSFIGQAFILLCFSLIISIFFYFKKENLLLIIAGVILIVLIGSSIVGGKHFVSKLSVERKELEDKLTSLKEKAIETGNPELCEEIEKTIKGKKTLNEGGVVHAWGDMANYYQPCIEEVAIKTGDEILCKKIEKVFIGSSPVYKCQKMVKALKTNNIDECGEVCECITHFAIDKNNPNLCEKCNYYDRSHCFSELVKKSGNNVETCKIISDPNDCRRCVTDTAIRLNNTDLCLKIKETCYSFLNEEKAKDFFTDIIDECFKKVKR